MAVTFNDLMKGFGIVTVMNACIFIPKKAYTGAKNCRNAGKTSEGGMSARDFVPAYEYIDTLKIANFTQEGPTKTVSGGQYANPLIKYGKTMTAEIQDALGRASTLERFFGVDYDGYYQFSGLGEKSDEVDNVTYSYDVKGIDQEHEIIVRVNGYKLTGGGDTPDYIINGDSGKEMLVINAEKVKTEASGTEGEEDYKAAEYYYQLAADSVITVYCTGSRLSITDKFPGPFAIEGDTFFIDQKTGEKKHVFIFIPQFVPDAILTLTQDAEGDATVFDLNGTVAVTDIQDDKGSRSVFYEIRETSFFETLRSEMDV